MAGRWEGERHETVKSDAVCADPKVWHFLHNSKVRKICKSSRGSKREEEQVDRQPGSYID